MRTRTFLVVDPADATPLWRQIEEGMRRLVARGLLAPGEPVPSVRDLARELVVNPATVSRAYQRLVDAGVLQVLRGEGTFVAESPPGMGRAEKRELLRRAAERYAQEAASLGAGEADALREVEAALKRSQREAG